MGVNAAPIRRKGTQKKVELKPKHVLKVVPKKTHKKLAIVTLGLLLGFAIFATVAARGVLDQRQMKLNSISLTLTSEQSQHKDLEATLAKLESPSRIVGIAQNQLGMSPPSTIIYISQPNTGPSTSSSIANGTVKH